MKLRRMVLAAFAMVSLSLGVAVASDDDHRREGREGREHMERGERHHSRTEFRGRVEKMPDKGLDGIWQVGEKKVKVTKDTRISERHGPAKVGCFVEVKGGEKEGMIEAYEVEVKRR